jgi:hypothetical protein
MQSSFRKQIIIATIILVALCAGVFVLIGVLKKPRPAPVVSVPVAEWPQYEIIGTSVEGRKIEAYTYESSAASAVTASAPSASSSPAQKKHLLFVGGIHGGYEWNSVLLAYQFMDYLSANPAAVPLNVSVTVIPSANPDGVFKVIKKEGRFALADVPATDQSSGQASGLGRFNAHEVDLNRNFNCNWQATSTWRSKAVSAGTAPFSEPEAAAIRDFVSKQKIDAAIFWHSQSNAVYASECNNGILPGTMAIMNAYAGAAGYPAVNTFDAYKVTGDAEGWLASINIPAITVELKTHETVEWDKNLAGVKALFGYFGAKR